jgi:hypothetical protein
MPINRSPYILNPIAHNLDLYDALCERLYKSSTLARIALNESFCELNDDFRYYLWTLTQLLDEALELNQAIIKKYPHLHELE